MYFFSSNSGVEGVEKNGEENGQGVGEDEEEEEEKEEEYKVRLTRAEKKLLPKREKPQHAAGSAQFKVKGVSGKEQRREHKRLVKLAKAEKRKKKIPKHLKKRATKANKKAWTWTGQYKHLFFILYLLRHRAQL